MTRVYFLSTCIAAFLYMIPTATLADITVEMQIATAKQGEKVFRKCKSCHTVAKGGKKKIGPNLYGILNKSIASTENFRYSKALSKQEGIWDLKTLDQFLQSPRKAVPGTKMTFAGLKKEKDRASLIIYLNQFSETPIDFTSDTVTSSPQDTSSKSESEEFGVLKIAPGVETTYYACTACHSERIVAQQGLSRTDWADLIEWMVEEQDMSEIEEPEHTEILDYLATHYGTERPNFPK